jgi:hypothetical protein
MTRGFLFYLLSFIFLLARKENRIMMLVLIIIMMMMNKTCAFLETRKNKTVHSLEKSEEELQQSILFPCIISKQVMIRMREEHVIKHGKGVHACKDEPG